jgi:hypothetical protein
MRRPIPFVLLLLTGACLATPPRPPEPITLSSSLSAHEAVERATVALASEGFKVIQTDSLAHAIAAARTSLANGNEEYVACELPRNSGGAANRETTVRISVSARPAAGGSEVLIRSTVLTSYPGFDGTPSAIAANEIDCVSKGVMEQRLARALR